MYMYIHWTDCAFIHTCTYPPQHVHGIPCPPISPLAGAVLRVRGQILGGEDSPRSTAAGSTVFLLSTVSTGPSPARLLVLRTGGRQGRLQARKTSFSHSALTSSLWSSSVFLISLVSLCFTSSLWSPSVLPHLSGLPLFFPHLSGLSLFLPHLSGLRGFVGCQGSEQHGSKPSTHCRAQGTVHDFSGGMCIYIHVSMYVFQCVMYMYFQCFHDSNAAMLGILPDPFLGTEVLVEAEGDGRRRWETYRDRN